MVYGLTMIQTSRPKMRDETGAQLGMFDKDSLEPLRDAVLNIDETALYEVLSETAARLHDNFPYFHPFYAGQMLKPPHPVAPLTNGRQLRQWC